VEDRPACPEGQMLCIVLGHARILPRRSVTALTLGYTCNS
jgi:hypothetical protein